MLRIHAILVWIRIITKYLHIQSTKVPSPRTKGWGAHSPAAKGVGEFQFRRLEKKLSTLPTLCGTADHPIFVIDLEEANKKTNVKKSFSAYYFLTVHLHHFSKIKSQKVVTHSRNQGFSYFFILMLEGSGAGSGSMPLTTGSGSRRFKNIRIRRIRIRIRIRNTDVCNKIIYTFSGEGKGRSSLATLFTRKGSWTASSHNI